MKLIWLFVVLGFVCGKIFFKRNFILIFYSFWVSFGNLYLLRMYAFHPGCLTYYHELLIFSCNSHFYRVYSDILSFILDFDNFFFFFFVILVRFSSFVHLFKDSTFGGINFSVFFLLCISFISTLIFIISFFLLALGLICLFLLGS